MPTRPVARTDRETLAEQRFAAIRRELAPPTWSAYEVMPGGREILLVAGLTYTQVLAARFPDAAWAVVWRQDPKR